MFHLHADGDAINSNLYESQFFTTPGWLLLGDYGTHGEKGQIFHPSRSSRKVTVTAHGRDETMRFSVY